MILSFSIFTFGPGEEEKVNHGLKRHLSFAQGQPGHRTSYVAQALDNPHKFLLYSEWDTKEHYEAMGKQLREIKEAQADFEEFFDLMIEEPILGSFEVKE